MLDLSKVKIDWKWKININNLFKEWKILILFLVQCEIETFIEIIKICSIKKFLISFPDQNKNLGLI